MLGPEDRLGRLRRVIQAPVKAVSADVEVPIQPTGDQRYAMTVIVDALVLVKTAVEKPKQKLSLRKRLIEIQTAFGYERDLKPLAEMIINPDAESDREIKRYLSRRGIRKAEYAEIQERFDAFYIIAGQLTQAYPGRQAFAQRREVLFNTNGQIFTETGVNAFRDNPHLLIDAFESTADFLNNEHPMG